MVHVRNLSVGEAQTQGLVMSSISVWTMPVTVLSSTKLQD